MKIVLRFTAAALVLAVAAGCNDSDQGVVIEDLDVASVQLTVQDLVVPINASVEASSVLQDAFEDLTDQGLEFDRADRPVPLALAAFDGAVELPTALPTVIPAELLGRTFVYDVAQDTWVADDARTGAPADGVRVIWYDLDGFGELILPPVEQGYTDLVPADAGGMNRLDVLVVNDTGDSPVALADLVHGYRMSGTDPDTTYYEAQGFYGDGQVQTTFDIDGTSTESTTGALVSDVFMIDLTRGSQRYLLEVDATIGDTEHYTGTVEQGSVRTVVDLQLAQTGQQGGSVSHNGSVVATILYNGGQFEFVPPGGGDFSGSQQQQLLVLTQTLLLAGLNLPLAMPLFFPN
jgi:hypothetical protein